MTEADAADMYVGIQTSIQQQEQWNAYGMGGGWRFGGGMATATSTTIQIGTLGVDFYDPTTKQLIWRGSATKTLNPSKNAQTNQNRVKQAVAKLLKSFPQSVSEHWQQESNGAAVKNAPGMLEAGRERPSLA